LCRVTFERKGAGFKVEAYYCISHVHDTFYCVLIDVGSVGELVDKVVVAVGVLHEEALEFAGIILKSSELGQRFVIG
jgi:hypothetical protein